MDDLTRKYLQKLNNVKNENMGKSVSVGIVRKNILFPKPELTHAVPIGQPLLENYTV